MNSEYWLRDYKRSEKKFSPRIEIELTPPYIRIHDNGLGVDPAYEKRIFQPFVTAKPKDIGRGLGLFIVQQLLDTVGGEILLLPKRNEFDRRYIFQIDLTSILVS